MPKPKITSAMELEALVQQMGFLPFFPCSIPNFSIETFTPSRYWFVEGVEGPWEWRMELARRGVVAYPAICSPLRRLPDGSCSRPPPRRSGGAQS